MAASSSSRTLRLYGVPRVAVVNQCVDVFFESHASDVVAVSANPVAGGSLVVKLRFADAPAFAAASAFAKERRVMFEEAHELEVLTEEQAAAPHVHAVFLASGNEESEAVFFMEALFSNPLDALNYAKSQIASHHADWFSPCYYPDVLGVFAPPRLYHVGKRTSLEGMTVSSGPIGYVVEKVRVQ